MIMQVDKFLTTDRKLTYQQSFESINIWVTAHVCVRGKSICIDFIPLILN